MRVGSFSFFINPEIHENWRDLLAFVTDAHPVYFFGCFKEAVSGRSECNIIQVSYNFGTAIPYDQVVFVKTGLVNLFRNAVAYFNYDPVADLMAV